MTKLISIDSGSSFLKFFDGQRIDQFPAVIEPIDPDAPRYPDEIEVMGVRYAVGQTALMARNHQVADPHVQRGFHGSPEQTVQMCFALQELGAHGTYDHLVVSLPYADHQDEAVRQAVVQRKSFEWRAGGQQHNVDFRHVITTPQGVGALIEHRSGVRDLYRLATLVDIGSCTLDVVTVTYDDRIHDYQFNHRASGSNRRVSVSRFKQQWVQRIHDLDGLQGRAFGYHELMGLPIRGALRIQHLGDTIDLRPSFDAVRREFTDELMGAVREITGDLWTGLEALIITGGGARLLDERAFDRRAVTLSGFANVRGQWLAAHPDEAAA